MQLSRNLEEWAVKQNKSLSTLLPLLSLLLGESCLRMRRILYAKAVDATGLLVSGTALEWEIYLLSILALGLFAAASRKQEGKILTSSVTALGQLVGAVGIGWTALRYPGEMPGLLGNLWRILGIVSALCLIWSAFCTFRGKTPQFLVLLAPCLFWLVHLVDNYRGWSGVPQLQSYLFALLGTMTMTLFSYYTAAGAVGLGKPRRLKFTALAAGSLCAAAAMPGKNQILYLLSALWALFSL